MENNLQINRHQESMLETFDIPSSLQQFLVLNMTS